MRGRERADPATEERRRAALGNRPAVNQVNQRTGRRAEPQEHDERRAFKVRFLFYVQIIYSI